MGFTFSYLISFIKTLFRLSSFHIFFSSFHPCHIYLVVSSMFSNTSSPLRNVVLKQTSQWIIYHLDYLLAPLRLVMMAATEAMLSGPSPFLPYLSYNVLIVETDWLAVSALLLGLGGPWQASHSCLVNRSNCTERGARVKALEHQAFGKEKPWRHDWVSNQREAEKGWSKCSAGWMEGLSVKYARMIYND